MSYRIDPARPLDREVARIARGEIAEAIAILEAGRDRRGGHVHDARKRFKRLRGLFRLAAGLDREFCRREERRIRDIAKTLSAARDAAAIVEAVDRLAAEAASPAEIDRLMAVRRGLVARRERIAGKQGATKGRIDEAIAGLGKAAKALDDLPDAGDAAATLAILAGGVRKTYAKGLKALARAKDRGHDEDFHDLRQAVKYHEMHMRLLGDGWPEPYKPRLELAEELGDLLGRLHDIPVLQETIEEERIGSAPEREALGKFLRKRKRKLAEDCLEGAVRLFAADAHRLSGDVALRHVEAADAAPAC